MKWDALLSENASGASPSTFESFPAGQPLAMGLADMEFPAPQPVIDALVARAQHGIFGYTSPSEGYFHSIIRWMEQRRGWHVERDWIITTPGVMQSVNWAIQTFTESGDGVIVQPPVFGPIPGAVHINGRTVLSSPLRQEGDRYLMDFDGLEHKAAGPRTKMLILCSPHNPVGRVWNHEELARLGDICLRHGLIIVSDEVHADLIYPGTSFRPMAGIDSRIDARLVVCTGASKSFNLPGLRTSLTFIPDPELRERFLATMRRNNELFGVNIMGTLALQTAFGEGGAWLDQLLQYLEGNLHFLQAFVKRRIPVLRVVNPESLFLVWIDCRALGLKAAELARLFQQGAKVYPEMGEVFGTGGEGFIRLNIACPRSMLATALERIANAIGG